MVSGPPSQSHSVQYEAGTPSCECRAGGGGGGDRTSSKNHMKKLRKNSWGCTGIAQVLVESKFAGVQWGSMLRTLLFLG